MTPPPSLWIEQSSSGQPGQAAPVLMISGLGYSSWCWADLRQALSPDYRVVTFDNRGTGRSDKPPGPYSIPMMADDAARVLDQCEISEAHVIGHSMGGYIAQTLALRHPQRVRSLVLIGTSPGGGQTLPVPQETQLAWENAAKLTPAEYARSTMPRSFAPGWTEKNPARFEELLGRRLEFPTPPQCWLEQFKACVEYVEQGVPVEEIRVPALVVHGREDRVVPHENGAVLARRLPGARFASLEGVGHLPYLEQPEHFLPLAREHLARKP
jgi:pimeloyl-ACP methyl ester carboxylesterase